MENPMSFASDNSSGISPQVMETMVQANQGHTLGYGDDPYTEKALDLFRREFGGDIGVFFVLTGSGANVLAMDTLSRFPSAVLTSENSHIHVDECGAPEKYAGTKVIPISTDDGKLTPEKLKPYLHWQGVCHHSQPRIVSITQCTEYGTLYQPEEIEALSEFAHDHQMYLHVDGARIANAAVALDMSLAEVTRDLGVDVISFGGTKNGLMMGEALVFFQPDLAEGFEFIRKQGMQLYSKMRFISVQFLAYFEDGLWRKNAAHANRMAAKLEEAVSGIEGVKITQKVECNSVFAQIPAEVIPQLQEKYYFYVWDPHQSEVRWMTSFDTREEDIEIFAKTLEELMVAHL